MYLFGEGGPVIIARVWNGEFKYSDMMQTHSNKSLRCAAKENQLKY